MYIGRQVIWRVKRADPNEPDDGARTHVVAPYRHSAFWAARDLLSFPAVRGRVDDLRLDAQMNHVVRLNHGVQCERRTALSLAPTTMAAVYKQRLFDHTIAYNAAIAAPVERKDIARNQVPLALDSPTTQDLSPSVIGASISIHSSTSDWRLRTR